MAFEPWICVLQVDVKVGWKAKEEVVLLFESYDSYGPYLAVSQTTEVVPATPLKRHPNT